MAQVLGARRCGAPSRGAKNKQPCVRAAADHGSFVWQRKPPPPPAAAAAAAAAKRAGLVAGAAALGVGLRPESLVQRLGTGLFGGDGSSGGDGFGNGGGGGGGGGSSGNPGGAADNPLWQLAGAARAESEDDSFLCEGIKSVNLPVGPGVPTQRELFEGLDCKPGKRCTRKMLGDDLNTLLASGLFQNVDANVTPTGKGYMIEFSFREKVWPTVTSFQIVGGKGALPEDLITKASNDAMKEKFCTVRTLATIKNAIEDYYQDHGLTFGTVSHFDGMETGELVANVIEGEISRINLVYVDPAGNQSAFGQTAPKVVTRELPFKVGDLYNMNDAKKALRDIFTLQLFDNVQVVPRPDDFDAKKVAVDVVLRERAMKTAEVELEWGIAPGDTGRPDLVSLRPGGSVFIEHRNLDGQGRMLFGSVSTANFFAPQDDLGFKLEYGVPYCKGDRDPKRSSFKASAFNSRKLSPVFTGGPTCDEVPAMWMDRAGLKASLTENFTRQSKCTTSIIAEEITARDESGMVCSNGVKTLPTGQLSHDGPRTTHTDSGMDRLVFFQTNLTRDNTKFVNGAIIGARDILQIDQSVGLGTAYPVFNHHSLQCTRFIQLNKPKKYSRLPPLSLILHGKYGGHVGDLAAYDAFSIGGPHSIRGYSVGELGVGRRVLETGAELRIPLPKPKALKGSQMFAFYEHATDLGSSKEVPGNPTEFYRRAGSGSSSGVGVKLGPVRAEWVMDMNMGKSAWYAKFGERW